MRNNLTRSRIHSSSAFTLVELLIVIVIIGIIAGTMAVKFNARTDKATTTMNLQALKALDLAAEAYIGEGLVTSANNTAWKDTLTGSGWMTVTGRTALIASLAAAGKITPEGDNASEAARFRAYITFNGTLTAPISVHIMQYQHATTDPYVVNGNKTCSAAFAANTVTVANGTDYSGFGTLVAWATAVP